ncbi:MAG: matrixin family metalloprotease [Bdellovibrionota bacterium]
MKRFLWALSLLFVMGCTKSRDCGFVQNVNGDRISWKHQIPIVLQIHSSFPKQNLGALKQAIEVWNKEAGENLFVLNTSDIIKGEVKIKKDGANVIYFANSWDEERASEQAKTSVYWKNDRIIEADIRVNASDFKFYSDADSMDERRIAQQTESAVHLKSLFVHELGHVLGLKHNDKNPSVMATYLQNNAVRTALSMGDRDSLKCEY